MSKKKYSKEEEKMVHKINKSKTAMDEPRRELTVLR